MIAHGSVQCIEATLVFGTAQLGWRGYRCLLPIDSYATFGRPVWSAVIARSSRNSITRASHKKYDDRNHEDY
jgi:hypothetical protein